jgi:hypothetical protein
MRNVAEESDLVGKPRETQLVGASEALQVLLRPALGGPGRPATLDQPAHEPRYKAAATALHPVDTRPSCGSEPSNLKARPRRRRPRARRASPSPSASISASFSAAQPGRSYDGR